MQTAIAGVGEFVGTGRTTLIEQHLDHLRHAALLHGVVENGGEGLT